jgi:hypothetical protein
MYIVPLVITSVLLYSELGCSVYHCPLACLSRSYIWRYLRSPRRLVHVILSNHTDVPIEGYALLGVVASPSGISGGNAVFVVVLEAAGTRDASNAAVLVALVVEYTGDALYKANISDVHVALM